MCCNNPFSQRNKLTKRDKGQWEFGQNFKKTEGSEWGVF